jgi:hypothetical protein
VGDISYGVDLSKVDTSKELFASTPADESLFPELLVRVREQVVKYGIETGKEMLAYVDMSGSIAGVAKGDENQVTMSDAGVTAGHNINNRIVAIHNHPNSSSLSPQDLATAAMNEGIVAIEAHNHEGYYFVGSLKNVRHMVGTEKKTRINRMLHLSSTAMNAFYDALHPAVKAKTISKADALLAMTHNSLVIMAKKKVIDYDWVDPKGLISAALDRVNSAVDLDNLTKSVSRIVATEGRMYGD